MIAKGVAVKRGNLIARGCLPKLDLPRSLAVASVLLSAEKASRAGALTVQEAIVSCSASTWRTRTMRSYSTAANRLPSGENASEGTLRRRGNSASSLRSADTAQDTIDRGVVDGRRFLSQLREHPPAAG